jgi:hypothetical protein
MQRGEKLAHPTQFFRSLLEPRKPFTENGVYQGESDLIWRSAIQSVAKALLFCLGSIKTRLMPQKLTPAQRAALEDFAWFKTDLEEMTRTLNGAITITITADRLEVHEQIDPFERIPFTKMHIENALALKREGKISLANLSRWARLVIAISAYDFEEECEDELAEWLHTLGFDIPATE